MANPNEWRSNMPTHPDDDPRPKMRTISPEQLGLPTGKVFEPALATDALEHARKAGATVLTALVAFDHIPAHYAVVMRTVAFEADAGWDKKSNGSYYQSDGGGLALHKAPLRMLAAAAGAEISTERMDGRQTPNVWEFRATVAVKTMDGALRRVQATKEIDLRDGSGTVEEWRRTAESQRKSAKVRIFKAREHGLRMAESKAVNAAIRSALGLPVSMTIEQARQPYVFPVLVYSPPVGNPAIDAMVAAMEMGLVDKVFGGGQLASAILTHGDVIEAEPAPEPRQLPDRGESDIPDFAAEAERLKSRETVPARTVQTVQAEVVPGAPECDICGKPLRSNVAQFSLERHKRPLCYDHQQRDSK